jgi:hypothetical protein
LSYFRLLLVTALIIAASPLPAAAEEKKRTATTTISITDSAGAVIPQAHVRIVPFPRLPRLETNGRGSLTVELLPGKYELFVNARGFAAKTHPFEISDLADQNVTVSLRVAGGSTVEVERSWSQGSERVWSMELAYWNHVKELDLKGFASLWHPNGVAWRDGSPRTRDDAIAWLKHNRDRGLYLEEFESKAQEIRITDNVAVTFYYIRSLWVNEEGRGTSRHNRVTHTWIKSGTAWRIVGEMWSD